MSEQKHTTCARCFDLKRCHRLVYDDFVCVDCIIQFSHTVTYVAVVLGSLLSFAIGVIIARSF